MKLTSLMTADSVIARMTASSKEEAFGKMLERFEEAGVLAGAPGEQVSVGRMADRLMEREARGITALGEGVGYPHARCEDFSNFILCLATVPKGVDYGASDGQPVRIILMAIAPVEKNSLLLGVMACLSHIIADADLRARMLGADDDDALWDVLEESDLRVKEDITAGDLMRRQFPGVPPTMLLADVAALMHREHVDAVPVLDGSQLLIGEVTARGLFRACMPAYFAELPTMLFARDFDAFEHFFREKAHLPVSDIMDRKVRAVDEDAPLAEVIGLLARRDVSRVYVTDRRRLVGVIDSFSIIDKVLAV
jgi:mannitol/fructose-specific phosphotransferase system IIA component (Ntr-type)/predicted transcriptional regulator